MDVVESNPYTMYLASATGGIVTGEAQAPRLANAALHAEIKHGGAFGPDPGR